jgi:2-oxoisovalerate dehydrogenase E2 component (dihydrolipoyl transacylase)
VVFEIAGGEAAPQVEAPKSAPSTATSKVAGPARSGAKGRASPAVRARATALGIDLSTIAGSGPGSIIQHGDLDQILQAKQVVAPALAKPAMGAREEGAEDIRIFGLRRRIAERMLDAKRRIPHFAYVEEVDVTELEALRGKLNSTHASRGRLTMLPFLIRALVKSIGQHPGVNAHFDDGEGVIRRFTSVHVGIATQTERGLLVPVIHNAETKDIWKLAAEIARLSEAARAGKSNREELSGSTITVTSLGALGGIAATPIINPPEVAIVGVNRMAERPMVRDGAVVIRKMMNLSSSFDHRIVDGYEAAIFIKAVKDCLEAPAGLVAMSSA